MNYHWQSPPTIWLCSQIWSPWSLLKCNENSMVVIFLFGFFSYIMFYSECWWMKCLLIALTLLPKLLHYMHELFVCVVCIRIFIQGYENEFKSFYFYSCHFFKFLILVVALCNMNRDNMITFFMVKKTAFPKICFHLRRPVIKSNCWMIITIIKACHWTNEPSILRKSCKI